jgi:tellurium resistance protein TerD
VFFNQLSCPEGGVEFAGTDDKEQIDVDLARVPEAVRKIAFIVYVDPDVRRLDSFGAVKNSYVRLADERNRKLLRFDIPGGNESQIKAMMFGELYHHADGRAPDPASRSHGGADSQGPGCAAQRGAARPHLHQRGNR